MPKLKPGTIVPTVAENKRIKSGVANDTDNPEWLKADFAHAKPAAEFFDDKTYAGLVELSKRGRGHRGPQKAPTKVMASVRFDQHVIDRLRESGRGWSTLVNDTMRQLLFGEANKPIVMTKAAKVARKTLPKTHLKMTSRHGSAKVANSSAPTGAKKVVAKKASHHPKTA